jgi:hypothetical protein
VTKITPKVTKMITSRSGKGLPSAVSGMARAAASETAPRIPLHPEISRSRALTRRSTCAGRRSSSLTR